MSELETICSNICMRSYSNGPLLKFIFCIRINLLKPFWPNKKTDVNILGKIAIQKKGGRF